MQAYRIYGSAELFTQHCQVSFLLWNEHLQEVIDELVMKLHDFPPNKRARVLTKVINRLDTQDCNPEAQTITAPSHEWLLPQGDIQRHPYVQPESAVEQRLDKTVEEQRVEQRVAPPMT
jgi:hypothetical protein